MRRTTLLLAAALVVPGAVAGCSPFASADPTTPPSTSSASSSSATPQDRLHEVYSRDELRAALPQAEDLGSGWAPPGPTTIGEIDDVESIDPPGCAAMLLRGPGWDEIQASLAGRADAHYAKGEQLAFVELRSFTDPFPADPFDEAGSALGRCASWTYDGSTYETGPLTLETFGDRSFAVRHRITRSDGEPEAYIDTLRLAVGHTYVVVAASSRAPQTPDTTVLREGARSVLSALERTP